MSNGKCSAEEDKILDNHDAFMAAPTLDSKVQILGENFRDGRLSTVRSFSELRRLLPWRPWMIQLAGGFSLMVLLGLAWGASAINKDVQRSKECADEAVVTATEAKTIAAKVSEATAAANAKLDLLLESKHISGPSRGQIRRAAVELGISIPADSVNNDSAPRGPN